MHAPNRGNKGVEIETPREPMRHASAGAGRLGGALMRQSRSTEGSQGRSRAVVQKGPGWQNLEHGRVRLGRCRPHLLFKQGGWRQLRLFATFCLPWVLSSGNE